MDEEESVGRDEEIRDEPENKQEYENTRICGAKIGLVGILAIRPKNEKSFHLICPER